MMNHGPADGPPEGGTSGLIGRESLPAPLKLVEFCYLLLEHPLELDGDIVAALFSAMGFWLEQNPTCPREKLLVIEAPL